MPEEEERVTVVVVVVVFESHEDPSVSLLLPVAQLTPPPFLQIDSMGMKKGAGTLGHPMDQRMGKSICPNGPSLDPKQNWKRTGSRDSPTATNESSLNIISLKTIQNHYHFLPRAQNSYSNWMESEPFNEKCPVKYSKDAYISLYLELEMVWGASGQRPDY